MSFVWVTLVLLLLILPGFACTYFYFLGSRISRETSASSPWTYLGGAVLVSFAIHGALLTVINSTMTGWLPHIDLHYVFAALQLQGSDQVSIVQFAANLDEYRSWLGVYIFVATVLGGAIGGGWSQVLSRGWVKIQRKHEWVYSLKSDLRSGFTWAYVLTNIVHEGRLLGYAGLLKDYFFQHDGRIAYLVLGWQRRFYVYLDPEEATTHQTASGAPDSADPFGRSIDLAYFLIEGDKIANVVFEKIAADFTEADVRDLRELAEVKSENGPAG